MRAIIVFLVVLTTTSACVNSPQIPDVKNEPKLVGAPCEGCEGVLEFNEKKLSSIDTLPGFESEGTRIRISGRIYKPDGKTPAEGIIMYIYHTDPAGIYTQLGNEKGWAKRHGYNRGWVKTDKFGRYSFYTSRPGIYPGGTSPAHIHPTILEPNGKFYYIEDYYFEGDSLLTNNELNPKNPRGGNSGVVSLIQKQGVWHGKRDIILGKNIPGY